jgi:hypothetical protein
MKNRKRILIGSDAYFFRYYNPAVTGILPEIDDDASVKKIKIII